MMTGWAVLMVEEFRVVLGRGNALVVRQYLQSTKYVLGTVLLASCVSFF